MLRSLNSGVNGMKAFQTRMDVIGNNIANSNTTGFKSDRASFQDSFNQTLRSGNPGSSVASGAASIQVGSGVSVAAIETRHTQGSYASTGQTTDLAIHGEGFFIVKDAIANEEYATRAGNFRIDSQGYLTTSNGFRVQGFSDAALSTPGDIRIDATGGPAGTPANGKVTSLGIDDAGIIHIKIDGGPSFERGQILLQKFTDAQQLTKRGGNLFGNLDKAGPLGGATATAGAPNSPGLGLIRSEQLEGSNVDLAEEFTGLITGQRGFQASARVITTSDDLLQEIVNLKR